MEIVINQINGTLYFFFYHWAEQLAQVKSANILEYKLKSLH